jgi:sugar lactone lactonase YvrE
MQRLWNFVVAAALLLAATTQLMADEWKYPIAIAIGPDKSIYVADKDLPGVWKLEGKEPKPYFTGSQKFRTPLRAVRCLAFDHDGKLLAGDSSTREVYRFGDDAQPKPLTNGGIGIPMGIAVNKAGELLVSDLELKCIWKVPAEGGEVKKFADVPAPHGVWIDAEDRLWVVSHGPNQLVRIAPDGKVEPVVKGQPFEFPHKVVVTAEGVATVSDGYAHALWRVEPDKEPVAWVKGPPLENPVDMVPVDDNLLVVDSRAATVFSVAADGKVTPLAGRKAK